MMEMLTLLLEKNRVNHVCTPGHSGIERNETTDRLARKGTKTAPTGPEPVLPLSSNSYQSKSKR